jgi:hypothetical protein
MAQLIQVVPETGIPGPQTAMSTYNVSLRLGMVVMMS